MGLGGHWAEQKWGPACPKGRDQVHSGLPRCCWETAEAGVRLWARTWRRPAGPGPRVGAGPGHLEDGTRGGRVPPEPRLLNPAPPPPRATGTPWAGHTTVPAGPGPSPAGRIGLPSRQDSCTWRVGSSTGQGRRDSCQRQRALCSLQALGAPTQSPPLVGKPKGAQGVGVGDRRSPTGGLQTRRLAARPGPRGRLELSPAGRWAGRPSELSGVTVPGPCMSAPGVAGSCWAGGDPRLGERPRQTLPRAPALGGLQAGTVTHVCSWPDTGLRLGPEGRRQAWEVSRR